MSRMDDIVNDASKFLKLSLDATLRRKGSFEDFHVPWKTRTFSLRSNMIDISLWFTTYQNAWYP